MWPQPGHEFTLESELRARCPHCSKLGEAAPLRARPSVSPFPRPLALIDLLNWSPRPGVRPAVWKTAWEEEK